MCWCLGLAVVVLVAAVEAQERRPAFGVVTADGGGVAGAAVVAAGSPWFGEVEGETDVVEAVTDARGRFVLRLLADREYAVFATAARAGGAACSAVAELVCGGDATLSLGTVQLPGRLRVTGEEDWREFAPLRFEVSRIGMPRWLGADADGALPPVGDRFRVGVRGADGARLWTRVLDGVAARTGALTLPPVWPLALRVTGDAGAPIAGAELWHELTRESRHAHEGRTPSWIQQSERPVLRRAGVTGADGTATLRLPVELWNGRVFSCLALQVRAPGRAEVRAGVLAQGPPFVGATPLPVPEDNVIPVSLLSDQELVVEPPAACSLLLVVDQMQGMARVETHLRAATDERGRGRVPLQLGQKRLSGFARIDAPGEPPAWSMLATDGATVTVSRRARRFDVQIASADGGPPRGIRCVVVPKLPTTTLPDLPVTLDVAGRGSIRLGPGDWLLLAADGQRVAHRILRAEDDGGDVSLVPSEPPAVTFRLRDSHGTPVPGATLPAFETTIRNVAGWSDGRFLSRQHRWWRHLRETGADARGCLVLPLPPGGTEIHVRIGGQTHRLEPGGVVDVVVE